MASVTHRGYSRIHAFVGMTALHVFAAASALGVRSQAAQKKIGEDGAIPSLHL
ncbi:hypothetical protein [Microbacterium sp.]|uniref:hypothetical protein n=1 Tax=Microbacterium sp. TaxID=51671 RepID=UPI0039E66C79